MNILRANWKVLKPWFLYIHFYESCAFEAIWMELHHENSSNLRRNRVRPRYIIYNLISFMKCNSFTIIFFRMESKKMNQVGFDSSFFILSFLFHITKLATIVFAKIIMLWIVIMVFFPIFWYWKVGDFFHQIRKFS